MPDKVEIKLTIAVPGMGDAGEICVVGQERALRWADRGLCVLEWEGKEPAAEPEEDPAAKAVEEKVAKKKVTPKKE